jgi:hypothetical protein
MNSSLGKKNSVCAFLIPGYEKGMLTKEHSAPDPSEIRGSSRINSMDSCSEYYPRIFFAKKV